MATENANGKTELCTKDTGVIAIKKVKGFSTIAMARFTLEIFRMIIQMAKALNNSRMAVFTLANLKMGSFTVLVGTSSRTISRNMKECGFSMK